jgi:pentatricopeptide repeat domain-containing protein 2
VEKFKAKMEEFVKDESSKNLIFTEDLKNMVHLSEIQDCPLVTQMIKRFCSQSKEVRFGNFVFGPVIMRLFHHLKDSQTALELFKDESLGGFFDQLVTYQILLDLLYEKGQYQEILDTFDIIQSRQLQGSRYPKHGIIVVFAACYKLNTPESLEYAKKVFHGAVDSGHIPLRRATTFIGALALNQNQPGVTMEVLSNLKGQNYVSVRALKVLALARMKRFDDVLPILRSILEMANPTQNKQTIPKDVLEILKECFKENTDKDLQVDFDKVINFLTTYNHVADQTLDEVLCSEIKQMPFNNQYEQGGGQWQGGQGMRNEQGMRPRRIGYVRQNELDRPSRFAPRRPGLHELN